MNQIQSQPEGRAPEEFATCGELYQIVRIDKLRARAHYAAQAAVAVQEARESAAHCKGPSQ